MSSAPLLPPFVPVGRVIDLPGRGETFFRHHVGGDPSAPTILLLHGWTASADLQFFTGYEQLGAKYNFLAIDHRGHGRGIRTAEHFTIEDAADDAAALVRALGLEQVMAVGYSMGGPVAQQLWKRHSDVVSSMVLCATALEWMATWRDRWSWRWLPIGETLMRSRVAGRITGRGLARVLRTSPELEPWLPWYEGEVRRGDVRAFIEAGRALSAYDFRPDAGRVHVPVTVVVTTRDHLVRPVKQRALAAATHADIVELAGDHLSPLFQARDFSVALRTAVDRTAARLKPQLRVVDSAAGA